MGFHVNVFCTSTVWVIELGKWDIKSALESGLETRELLDKYRDKGIYRIIRSIGELDPDDDSVPKEALGILDMEGYTLEQLSSGPGMANSVLPEFHKNSINLVSKLLLTLTNDFKL